MKDLQLQLEKLQEKHKHQLQEMSDEQKLLKGDELRLSWDKEDEMKEEQRKESSKLLQLLYESK